MSLFSRFRRQKEDPELARRAALLRHGRIGDATVVETDADPVSCVALNLEEDALGALALGDYTKIKSGQTVKRTKKICPASSGLKSIARLMASRRLQSRRMAQKTKNNIQEAATTCRN